MHASNKNLERYRLREDLRRLGKVLDKRIDVPEPSAEIREHFRRLSEAEYEKQSHDRGVASPCPLVCR